MAMRSFFLYFILVIAVMVFIGCSTSKKSVVDDGETDNDSIFVDETVDETVDEAVDEAVDETVDETADETVDEDIVVNDPPEVLSVIPAHLSSISKTDAIVIVFSETIDKTTFLLSGSSAALSDGGVWSTTTVTDDTLTLTPTSEWAIGDTFLTLDYSDLLGASGEKLSLHYTVQVIFVNEGVGDSAAGSMTDPMHSVRDAQVIANTQWPGGAQVHVMAGTYVLAGGDDIELIEGVSLYGGYEPDNWSHRDSTLYISLIQGSDTKDRVVFADSGVTSATTIDGFTIHGGTNTESVNIIGILCHGASPTISNNIIRGGTTVDQSWGVYLTDGAMPLVTNNSIHGGTSDKTRGLYLGVDAAPTITKNTIYGGDAGDNSVGIYNSYNSHATITENSKIDGGTGKYSRGIMNTRTSSPTITDNPDIFGGENKESVGIKNDNESKAVIQNNTIDGGEGTDTRGINNNDSSEPTIVQNTIVGGKGITYTCGIVNMESSAFIRNNTVSGGDGTLYACGIANLEASTPTITENIINGGAALESTGIYNQDVVAPVATFFSRNIIEAGNGTIRSGGVSMDNATVALSNNIIFGGNAAKSYGVAGTDSVIGLVNNTIDGGGGTNAYGIGCKSSQVNVFNNIIFTSTTLQGFGVFEEDGSCVINTFETNNIYSCSAAFYHEYTGGGGNNFAAIASMESVMNSAVADSASNNISELLTLDSEYRFIGTLDSVSFDTAGQDFSGMIDDDKDGAPRSGDGDLGYSIGAYEYD